jgi:hypothetical protein
MLGKIRYASIAELVQNATANLRLKVNHANVHRLPIALVNPVHSHSQSLGISKDGGSLQDSFKPAFSPR